MIEKLLAKIIIDTINWLKGRLQSYANRIFIHAASFLCKHSRKFRSGTWELIYKMESLDRAIEYAKLESRPYMKLEEAPRIQEFRSAVPQKGKFGVYVSTNIDGKFVERRICDG